MGVQPDEVESEAANQSLERLLVLGKNVEIRLAHGACVDLERGLALDT